MEDKKDSKKVVEDQKKVIEAKETCPFCGAELFYYESAGYWLMNMDGSAKQQRVCAKCSKTKTFLYVGSEGQVFLKNHKLGG